MGSLFFFESKITGFRHYFDMDSPYPIAMTTDKVFILLLVILLPITGCIDMTDNAEAQEEPDSTTVDNSTEVSTLPTVYSLYLEKGTVATFDFDGTETLKLETIHRNASNSVDGSYEYSDSFVMTCDGSILIDNGRFSEDEYLPILGGQNCSIEITSVSWDTFYIFSKSNLESIR